MGPVRMISSGHELTTDYDEKTLHELGFKDMQVTTPFVVFYQYIRSSAAVYVLNDFSSF